MMKVVIFTAWLTFWFIGTRRNAKKVQRSDLNCSNIFHARCLYSDKLEFYSTRCINVENYTAIQLRSDNCSEIAKPEQSDEWSRIGQPRSKPLSVASPSACFLQAPWWCREQCKNTGTYQCLSQELLIAFAKQTHRLFQACNWPNQIAWTACTYLKLTSIHRLRDPWGFLRKQVLARKSY